MRNPIFLKELLLNSNKTHFYTTFIPQICYFHIAKTIFMGVFSFFSRNRGTYVENL